MSDYPFINHLDKTDTIEIVADYIENYVVENGKFALLQDRNIEYMHKREYFLSVPIGRNSNNEQREIFKSSTQDEVNAILNKEHLDKDKYFRRLNSLCKNCADKDICLEIYKVKKR